MREFPRGGLLGRVQHWVRQFSALGISVHASSASFFLVLSVFPGLLLLLSLLRYTPLEVSTLLEGAAGFLPEALLPYGEALVRELYENASGTLASISAVTALWSASRGIQGLLTGLEAIYGTPRQQGWLRSRLVSAGYTLAFLGVLTLTLVLQIFGNAIVAALRTQAHPFIRFVTGLVDLRFFLLLMLQTALFTAMFSVAHREADTVAFPGAVLASLGWLVFSRLFSWYLDYFGDNTDLYGSVYTVALSMLWLYLCISIVFYGAALNRFLSAWKDGKL